MHRRIGGTVPLEEYRKQPHWSFSALNQLLNICSLQWAFQRVDKLEPAFTSVNLCFGSAYHRTMEWIGMMRMQGTLPDVADAQDVFTDMWERQVQEERAPVKYKPGESSDTIAAQGRGLIACFIEHADPAEEVLAVNYTFSVPLVTPSGVQLVKPLIGEIDAVYGRNGKPLLIDWKTAARRWPARQAETIMQATAMLYGYNYDHGVIPHFRFDVLVKNKTPIFETHEVQRTPDDFERLVCLVQQAEDIVRHGVFYPSEQSNFCGGCPYQQACKAWHRQQARVTLPLAA